MADPTFQQAEPRRAMPLVLAVAGLACVAALVFYLNPRDAASIAISNIQAVPIRTNFKSDLIVIGAEQTGQDDLYILMTIRIEDHLRLPITIDTMTATLVTAEGRETTTSAAAKDDIPALLTTFPQLKALALPPLLRETEIGAGGMGEGQVVVHFPVTRGVWDARRSATLEVDLYHQKPLTVVIPK